MELIYLNDSIKCTVQFVIHGAIFNSIMDGPLYNTDQFFMNSAIFK